MNCTACPYQKQIDALRRRCIACNPETTGGTPHGKVKADEFTLNSAPRAIDFDRSPSTRATHLAPEDEHKLRMAMTSLFGLDPIDLLLVHHLMQGGHLEDFDTKLDAVVARSRGYRGATRGMAWAKKVNILRKLPIMAEVLKNTRENDSATRIIRELDND